MLFRSFEQRCVFPFAPLTDPAKGSACMHRACFNYDVLLIWDSLIWDSLIWVYMGTARASTTTCFATTWVVLGRLARSSQIKPDQARSSQIKPDQGVPAGYVQGTATAQHDASRV